MIADQTRIRQALIIIDKNTTYKFDLNQSITIKGLKKMIGAAANLGKNSLRLYHRGRDYTYQDDASIIDLFPDLELIDFTISMLYDEDDETARSLKLKLGKNRIEKKKEKNN